MTSATETKSRRMRIAPVVVLVLVAGLFAMIASRYKQAVAERASIAQEGATATATAAAASAAEGSAAPTSRTTHGIPEQWQPSVSVSGTLLPAHESTLGFKVSGRLSEVRVKIGDVVKAGSLLASLDASDTAAQLRAANAQVHSAQVSLEIASDEAGRSKALLSQGAISDAQHRANTQRTEIARAGLEAAQAQAATVAAMLDNMRLIAPFSGLVTQAPSAPGAVVSPPNMALFRVQDTTSLIFSGTLSVEDAALAQVGTKITLDGDHPAQGLIYAILPSVDPQTRRVPFLAEIKNDPKAPILAGIFARATLHATTPIAVVKLPAEALRPGSQNEVVVIANGRAQLTPITFTRSTEGTLYVRAGVQASDTVVLMPSASVKNGDVINLGAPNAG